MDSSKKSRGRFWLTILTLVIVACAFVGVAFGKYIQTSMYTGELQFNAKLADSFEMLEHRAERQNDGSYVLNAGVTVTENDYELIPGLDIHKDPYVRIVNKTSIEAYLYLEVVDATNNSAIEWELEGHWLLLDGVTGKKNNGAVYVYAADGVTPTPLTRQEGELKISVLKDNMVYVKQKLLMAETNDALTFYAAMGEVNAVKDGSALNNANAIYKDHVRNVTP